ncbi:hypothetical protein [Achromobacter sp. MFA1 R4]|uniref:hypothetical protein n=1 Tax=Achromobacter sp. MFA1 R4 TaxID=1881016 RepID=UPI0009537880|nr:hypothetical protein [Achromobacter sp. MFA1 R4]SIT28062.1 hypothetical protein SAMN05428937_3791 [Achromobacter sp. MFA1 R4]SIT33424.1 hypothetical protein SAMN05428937_5736 [Achromobacter sp. MFA1 R4]
MIAAIRMLAGWKGYLVASAAGAVVLSLAGAGIAWYGHSQREAGRAECQEAHRVAGLEEFKSEAERLTGLSGDLQARIDQLAASRPQVIERYTREIVQRPLPADCVRDPSRVRATNDAIDAANAARQPQRGVPADSSH